MEEWKIIYLAGIIDGEGSISILKQKNRKNCSYSLFLAVNNTDKRLVDWLKENFNGNYCVAEEKDNQSRMYNWRLYKQNDIINLLKRIKPYSVIKQEQIDLAIRFNEETQWGAGKGEIPLRISLKREKYFQEIKALHL